MELYAEKVASRPGGYTRIIKLGNRLGDNADMCLIELVDFNETLLAATAEKATKTRRSRRGGAKKSEDTPSAEVVETVAAPVAEVAAPAVEEAPETPAEEKTEE